MPPEAPLTRTRLAGADLAVVADGLEGHEAGHRHCGGLLEGQVGGLQGKLVIGCGRVLGVRAGGCTEDLVAWLEPRHGAADSRHMPGHVRPTDADLWPPQAVHGASDVRQSAHHGPVGRVDAGRSDADQHFVVPDPGPFDLSEFEPLAGAVVVLDDRQHRITSR